MSQLDGSSEASARGEAEASSTRVTRVALPPPPVAGLRTVARLRGAFDEGLPTLRLPALPPRALAEADAEALDRAVRTAREETTIGRPFPPSSILRTGPRVLAPSASPRAIRDLVDDTDPEEVDDADLLDDDAGATLVRPIARSIHDAADTLPGAPIPALDDAAAMLDGAPVATIHDPTPVVHTPVLAVPPPAVLVHAIVGARPAAPRSRAWAWAVIAPLVVLALAATAWALVPTTPSTATITASLPDELPQRIASSAIATPIAIVTPSIEATPPVIPSPDIAAPPVRVAPSIPPAPPVLDAPIEIPAATPAASVEPTRKRSSKRSRPRPRSRARASTPAPVAAAPAPQPPPVRRVPAPSHDATALLHEAERAFAEGRFATALHFADRSRAQAPDARAARIAALAACRIGRATKAKAAYTALPAGQRASVRSKCDERGIDLG